MNNEKKIAIVEAKLEQLNVEDYSLILDMRVATKNKHDKQCAAIEEAQKKIEAARDIYTAELTELKREAENGR